MKVVESCDKHGLNPFSYITVSENVYKAWKEGEVWDLDNFKLIRHLMLAVNEGLGTKYWITSQEAKNLDLPTNRVLNEEETDVFIDWSDSRTRVICGKCFQDWRRTGD
jgi:hypothetical protein